MGKRPPPDHTGGLTISEVSRILGVSMRQVGRLARWGCFGEVAYNHCGHTRVAFAGLREFMRDRNIDLPSHPVSGNVVLGGCRPGFAEDLARLVDPGWKFTEVTGQAEIGLVAGRLMPDALVIDARADRVALTTGAIDLAPRLRQSGTRTVVILPEGEPVCPALASAVAAVVRPSGEDVAEFLRRLYRFEV